MSKSVLKNASIQFGWPDNIQLPTLQEAEEAVQMIEIMANELLDELNGKLEGTSPEMLSTQITV